jgi:spore germination cell wall hydrolase CwlJ-like protein
MSKAILILAYLLWHEARGEGKLGIDHVASVVVNSAPDNGLDQCFNLCYEALKPGRYDSMKGKTAHDIDIPKKNNKKEEEMWAYCIQTASLMCRGKYTPINTATHFYNPKKCSPSYGPQFKDAFEYGNHRFGRL